MADDPAKWDLVVPHWIVVPDCIRDRLGLRHQGQYGSDRQRLDLQGSFSARVLIWIAGGSCLSIRWDSAASPLLRRSRGVSDAALANASLDSGHDRVGIGNRQILIASIGTLDELSVDLHRYCGGPWRLFGSLHRRPMGFAVHQESDSFGDRIASGAFDEPRLLHLHGRSDGGTLVAADCILRDHCILDLVDDEAVDGAADRLEVLLAT